MLKIFTNGIDISRHHLKGIYVFMVGKDRHPPSWESKDRKQSSHPLAEVICTFREAPTEELPEWASEVSSSSSGNGNQYGPIKISYQGQETTLRPWDPECCPLAAAIHNRIIHFPIRPKSVVLALDFSLRTLSHISDALGPKGRLIAVMGTDSPTLPSQGQIGAFMKSHRNATVVVERFQFATLERYERLLSLPESSRSTFLMGLHPRLGADSPARLLNEDAPKLCGLIFSFLENFEPSLVKSLVVRYWPEKIFDTASNREVQLDHDAQVDHAREALLNHIDILHRWRRRPNPMPAGTDTSATAAEKDKRNYESEGSQEKERMWVLLDIRTDTTREGTVSMKMVNDMKWLKSGLRTGLVAKEQLALTPWFPNHALLLLKYLTHRDERRKKVQKDFPMPPGLKDEPEKLKRPERHTSQMHQPPPDASMPVPSFLAKSASPTMPPAPPPPAPGLCQGQASSSSSFVQPVQLPTGGQRPLEADSPPGMPAQAPGSSGLASWLEDESQALMNLSRPFLGNQSIVPSGSGPGPAGMAGQMHKGMPPHGMEELDTNAFLGMAPGQGAMPPGFWQGFNSGFPSDGLLGGFGGANPWPPPTYPATGLGGADRKGAAPGSCPGKGGGKGGYPGKSGGQKRGGNGKGTNPQMPSNQGQFAGIPGAYLQDPNGYVAMRL